MKRKISDSPNLELLQSEMVNREYFLSQIIQGLPGAFYTCDLQGKITYYNDTVAKLWGRKPEIGKDLWCGSWKIFTSDGQFLPLEECPMARCLKEGKIINGEEIIIERPDGVRRNILPHPRPLFDTYGKLIGAFNILVDITGTKNARKLIRQGEQFLQRLVSGSNDCIKVLDLDGNLLSMNKGGQELMEIDNITPFLGISCIELWKGPEKELAIRAIETAKNGKIGKFIGYFPTLKTKTPKWWHVVVSTILDANGKPEKLLAVSRDITDQKWLEEQLKEQNKTLEILHQIGKIISSELELEKVVQSITDSATEISGAEIGAFYYNDLGEKNGHFDLYAVSGASKETLQNFHLLKLIEKYSPDFLEKLIVRVDDITIDRRNNLTHIIKKSDGHSPVVSYMVAPVTSRTGEKVGFLFFGHSKAGFFTNKSECIITGIASQAAIAIENSRLFEASKADKEKLAAANKELKLKNEELQKTNIDLDNFIYTASHDLKAPVTNIEGLVKVLSEMVNQENSSNEQMKEIMDMINLSINRFSNTIRDLTTITKVQKEIDEEELEKINVREIIEDIRISNLELINNTQTILNYDLNENLAIRFSRKSLHSILYNLISNAIKYQSPDRPPEITISEEINGDYTVLKIKDNGLGLDKSSQGKMFSMFKRFHDHVEGTGIGLYLVKRIITNAGGKIEVESEPNTGSVFKVYFKN